MMFGTFDRRSTVSGVHVAHGATRYVVEDLRDGHGLGDVLEVQVQAFRVGLL